MRTVRNHPVIKQNYGLTYKALLKCDYLQLHECAHMGAFCFMEYILVKVVGGHLLPCCFFIEQMEVNKTT